MLDEAIVLEMRGMKDSVGCRVHAAAACVPIMVYAVRICFARLGRQTLQTFILENALDINYNWQADDYFGRENIQVKRAGRLEDQLE